MRTQPSWGVPRREPAPYRAAGAGGSPVDVGADGHRRVRVAGCPARPAACADVRRVRTGGGRRAVSAGTRRAYGSYWNRVVQAWGDRPIDEPLPSEIEQLRAKVQANVAARRNSRGGRAAAE